MRQVAMRGSCSALMLSRKLVAGVGHAGGRWSCGDLWAEENVVSEVVEAPDQVGCGARPCLLIKERLSEFLESACRTPGWSCGVGRDRGRGVVGRHSRVPSGERLA